MRYRVGIGYDSHRFIKGRRLILGGIEIPSEYGLLGHSDGDALIHSIIDALLGAYGMYDIGELFPSSSKEYEGISSVELLKRVVGIVKRKFRIVNVDSIIITEFPKILPYKKDMVKKLSEIIGTNSINIKGKSNEELGFVGRKEGLVALSVVLLKRRFLSI